jgi:hypothetical protein
MVRGMQRSACRNAMALRTYARLDEGRGGAPTGKRAWTRLKLRFLAPIAVGLLLVLTRTFWIRTIAQSLICAADDPASAEAVLVENFEIEYPLFEEAARIQRSKPTRILVPVPASANTAEPNLISVRIVDVMASVARLQAVETIPVIESEPVVLHTAYAVRRFLRNEHIHSVAIVAPAFRSARSALVFKRVFGEAGIAAACVPVLRNTAPYTWADSWHGIQQVTEQFAKLQYYRFYVLPFIAKGGSEFDFVPARARR